MVEPERPRIANPNCVWWFQVTQEISWWIFMNFPMFIYSPGLEQVGTWTHIYIYMTTYIYIYMNIWPDMAGTNQSTCGHLFWTTSPISQSSKQAKVRSVAPWSVFPQENPHGTEALCGYFFVKNPRAARIDGLSSWKSTWKFNLGIVYSMLLSYHLVNHPPECIEWHWSIWQNVINTNHSGRGQHCDGQHLIFHWYEGWTPR